MKLFNTLLLTAGVLLASSRVEAATLTITTNGTNTGAVGVQPTGQICNPGGGGTCNFTIANGTQVVLSANSPSTPGIFSAGTGDAAACGPTSTCKFTINGDSSIVVSFNAGSYPSIQILLTGDGKGEVGNNNNRCQNFELGFTACTSYYAAGSEVTLEGRSVPGNLFTGFSAGTANASGCATTPCVFTLMGNSTVSAGFAALTSVTVTPSAPTITAGQAQNFTATGTFSNSATRSLFAGTGLWGPGSAMSSARFGAAAGVLNQRVYVVGGGAASPLNSVEAYNPATGSWTTFFSGPTPFASMSVPRQNHVVAVIGNVLYAVGGYTSGGAAVASVEAYDPTTNSWTPKAAMPTARATMAAAVINGVLYVVGGGESPAPLNTLESYNPTTNTWTTLAPMPTARRYLVAATVNGLLYAIGGDSAGTVEVYDPTTNTWAAKAPRPSHKGGGAAGVIDGLIYVVGGFGQTTSSKIVEVYNPATDTWVGLASMQTGRDEAVLAALDGRLFVAGGKTGPDPTTRVATLERFRPPEISWWSSNESVATLNQTTGMAIAVAAGIATISARAVGIDCATTSGCATLTVSGGPSGPPGAPGAPVVSGSGNQVTFAWSAPTTGAAVQNYTLIARLTPGGPIVASLPVGSMTSLTVDAPNGTFIVSVQASNASGTGPESPTITVTIPFVGNVPGAPQNLAASMTGTTAHITWSAPATGGAPTGYQLLASLSPGGGAIATLPIGNVTSLSVPGVPPGVFYLRLVATNAAGSGPASNEVILNAAGCTLPDTPQGLTVGHADGVATASWNAVSGATSYTLFVQSASGGPFLTVGTVTGVSVSAPVGSGTDVFVSVMANNTCGSSAMATPQRLTVP